MIKTINKSKLYIQILFYIFIAFLIFSVQGCAPDKLTIDSNANPLYVTTEKGLTVIDTKTDKILIHNFQPNYSDEIAAFYKTLLFTEFSGTDFPVNVSPRTSMIDLKTGKQKKIARAQIACLKKENNFLYGLGFENEIIFIYNIVEKNLIKVKSSDPYLMPTFIGFTYFNRKRAIVLSDMDSIEIKTLDGQRLLYKKKIFNSAAVMADNDKIIAIGRKDIKTLDFDNNKVTNIINNLPEYVTTFYSHGRLYIGKSTSDQEKPKLSTYSVYSLGSGKLIKKLKMDVRDYNVIKINDLLLFFTGPHKGYALDLKSSEIVRTDITEQSVVQDGKIYSLVNDRLLVRRGSKLLKIIKLSANGQKKWKQDTSSYNPAIYSSLPTNDNFKVVENL